jgi:hypothetical protein
MQIKFNLIESGLRFGEIYLVPKRYYYENPCGNDIWFLEFAWAESAE